MHRENMKSFGITMVTALGLLLGASPIASAQNTQCNGTIQGGTIDSNITVPSSASCTIKNETVNGNISVGTGAKLIVTAFNGQTVTINGNITANQCNDVSITSDIPLPGIQPGTISVAGNVSIKNCRSASGVEGPTITINGNFVCANVFGVCFALNAVIYGNLNVDNNGTPSVGRGADIIGNQISGNADVSGNTGHLAAIVSSNTINGNLTCFNNTIDIAAAPVTDNGVPNTVSGTKQGQCANL